jgi:type IX secretion system PorP/SprF family membrane protein
MIQKNYRHFLKKIFLLILLVNFFNMHIYSQDLHFTMFSSCPLYLNPANTGNFYGDWRVALNYRNQWSALNIPFVTATVSGDKKIYLLNQDFSIGGVLINDKSGALALSVNKIYGSFSYKKFINRNYFYAGIQFGYVFKSLDMSKVTLPSQYNHSTGGFDSQLPTNETNMGNRITTPDFNLGFLWQRKVKIFEPEAGLAFSHLNNPKESFFDDNQRLPIRLTLHGNVRVKINDEFYIQPLLLLMYHKKSRETVIGTNAGFKAFGNKSRVKELFAGLYFRSGFLTNADALAVMAGVNVARFDVALCYDLTVSTLRQATNYNGAFEISIIYKSISTVLNSYSIPCERF